MSTSREFEAAASKLSIEHQGLVVRELASRLGAHPHMSESPSDLRANPGVPGKKAALLAISWAKSSPKDSSYVRALHELATRQGIRLPGAQQLAAQLASDEAKRAAAEKAAKTKDPVKAKWFADLKKKGWKPGEPAPKTAAKTKPPKES